MVAIGPNPIALFMYAVYERPRDYPDEFVVRSWQIVNGAEVPGPLAGRGATLEEARRCIAVDRVRLGRFENDDPCIVETWI